MDAARGTVPGGGHHGYYGVQVLIAGRRKSWRDEMNGEVRRAGFHATSVDSAIDALTVLALGLPVDVLLTDIELHGKLGCCRLAKEARALRPNLRIVFARDFPSEEAELAPGDAVILPMDARLGGVAGQLRKVLPRRASQRPRHV